MSNLTAIPASDTATPARSARTHEGTKEDQSPQAGGPGVKLPLRVFVSPGLLQPVRLALTWPVTVMCAYCKKVESQQSPEKPVSHGICPECAPIFFPGIKLEEVLA